MLEDCLFSTPCLPVAGGCWFVVFGVKEKLTICHPAAVLHADRGDNLPAPETVSTQSSCGGRQFFSQVHQMKISSSPRNISGLQFLAQTRFIVGPPPEMSVMVALSNML